MDSSGSAAGPAMGHTSATAPVIAAATESSISRTSQQSSSPSIPRSGAELLPDSDTVIGPKGTSSDLAAANVIASTNASASGSGSGSGSGTSNINVNLPTSSSMSSLSATLAARRRKGSSPIIAPLPTSKSMGSLSHGLAHGQGHGHAHSHGNQALHQHFQSPSQISSPSRPNPQTPSQTSTQAQAQAQSQSQSHPHSLSLSHPRPKSATQSIRGSSESAFEPSAMTSASASASKPRSGGLPMPHDKEGRSEAGAESEPEKPKKKKNKKGMKGWAWIVEDENGNIIDAPEVDVELQTTTTTPLPRSRSQAKASPNVATPTTQSHRATKAATPTVIASGAASGTARSAGPKQEAKKEGQDRAGHAYGVDSTSVSIGQRQSHVDKDEAGVIAPSVGSSSRPVPASATTTSTPGVASAKPTSRASVSTIHQDQVNDHEHEPDHDMETSSPHFSSASTVTTTLTTADIGPFTSGPNANTNGHGNGKSKSNGKRSRNSSSAGSIFYDPTTADNVVDEDADMLDGSSIATPRVEGDPLSNITGQSGSDSSAPTPAPTTTAASSTKPLHSSRLDPSAHTHPKKRRKTSPPYTAPPLDRSNSTSKAPTVASKGKTPRLSGTAAPPTRAHKALLIRDTRPDSSRAGSQHVVEDDAPLPPPPRAGMGEGGFETPKESALREETVLRREAAYIIDHATKARLQQEKRRAREEANGTTLVSGRRARRPVNYADSEDDEDDYDNTNGRRRANGHGNGYHSESIGEAEAEAGPGPSTSRRRQSQYDTSNGDHEAYTPTPNERIKNSGRRESAVMRNFPAPVMDTSFDGQFALLQKGQRAMVAAQKAADQDRPPVFGRNSKPAVVLAPSGQPRYHPRDRTERAYADGLAGMSQEMEIDAQGFVDNVKDNLRAILKYYFPERSSRRDAFCERIGRGLQQLGWELTDNTDAALLP